MLGRAGTLRQPCFLLARRRLSRAQLSHADTPPIALARERLLVAFEVDCVLHAGGPSLSDDALPQPRPGLVPFLTAAALQFDLMVFTQASAERADAFLDSFDPNRLLLRHRLYKQHCWSVPGSAGLAKNLILINRSPARLVLVDHQPVAFFHHFDNGILVPPYLADDADEADAAHEEYHASQLLPALFGLLDKLDVEDDVRPTLARLFSLRERFASELTNG